MMKMTHWISAIISQDQSINLFIRNRFLNSRRQVLQPRHANTPYTTGIKTAVTLRPNPRLMHKTPHTSVRSLFPIGPSYLRWVPSELPSTPAYSLTTDNQSKAPTHPACIPGIKANGHMTSASLTTSPSSFSTAPDLDVMPCSLAIMPSRAFSIIRTNNPNTTAQHHRGSDSPWTKAAPSPAERASAIQVNPLGVTPHRRSVSIAGVKSR